MKRIKTIIATGLFLSSCLYLNAQLPKINKELSSKVSSSFKNSSLTEDEVAKGIKEALNKGIENGVNLLSAKDGYYKDLSVKIPLPNEAEQIEEKLRKIGQGQLITIQLNPSIELQKMQQIAQKNFSLKQSKS